MARHLGITVLADWSELKKQQKLHTCGNIVCWCAGRAEDPGQAGQGGPGAVPAQQRQDELLRQILVSLPAFVCSSWLIDLAVKDYRNDKWHLWDCAL